MAQILALPNNLKEQTIVTVANAMKNGKEIPENYIHRGFDAVGLGVSLPLLEIPVIDISLLPSSPHELEKLRSALLSYGCFQAINHGFTEAFLNKIRHVARQFFALPEKQNYSKVGFARYKSSDDSENRALPWAEKLYLMLSTKDEETLKRWPQNPKPFQEILDEYSTKLQGMNEVLFKALARALDLEENIFWRLLGEEPELFARLNFYPPCPRPDLALGFKPHTDGSVITILLQENEVEALQVFKDNQWFRACILPQVLLVSIGDQAEIMSNGVLKSMLHRVVTNTERERVSMAVFCIPSLKQEIGPVKELVSETRPASYKKVKNYVDMFFQRYDRERTTIEAAKININ
ncbi:hypothetical protein SLE2022_322330 [Rubroshorea leprosula]